MTDNLDPGVGALLRNRRRQKGLSIEQAARDIRINARFLKALEEEKWDEFPARVYLQGFLKRYADTLGLNGEELVAMYKKQSGPAESKNAISPHQSPPAVVETDSRLNTKLVLLALGVIALLVAGVYVLDEPGERAAPPRSREVRGTDARGPAPRTITEGEREFEVRYRDTAWSRVFVDGQVIFEGLSTPGTTRLWKGRNRFKLVSPRLVSLEVRVDGKRLENAASLVKDEIGWSYEEDLWRQAAPPPDEGPAPIKPIDDKP